MVAANPYAAGSGQPQFSAPAPDAIYHGQIRPANLPGNLLQDPPGWAPCWMWDGLVTHYTASGARLPNLFLVEHAIEYQEHLEEGWVHASQLPAELRDAIIDATGEANLTDAQRLICADRLAARHAAASKPAIRVHAPRRKRP